MKSEKTKKVIWIFHHKYGSTMQYWGCHRTTPATKNLMGNVNPSGYFEAELIEHPVDGDG